MQAVEAYKQLSEVERGFAHLKGLLEVRPVYHRAEARVRAHVFVAALAFLLDGAGEETAGGGKFALLALRLASAGKCALCGGGLGAASQVVCQSRQCPGGPGAQSAPRHPVGSTPPPRWRGNRHVVTNRENRPRNFNNLRSKK